MDFNYLKRLQLKYLTFKLLETFLWAALYNIHIIIHISSTNHPHNSSLPDWSTCRANDEAGVGSIDDLAAVDEEIDFVFSELALFELDCVSRVIEGFERLRSSATFIKAPISKFNDCASRRFSFSMSSRFRFLSDFTSLVVGDSSSSTENPNCGYLNKRRFRDSSWWISIEF